MIVKIQNKITEKEAIQFIVNPEGGVDHNWHECEEFIGKKCKWENGQPIIETLEGEHKVTDGDWIIKGLRGEFYPCKPDIFVKSYEIIA